MTRVDWRYHRPGCTSCKRTLEFLAQNKVEDGEVRSATKEPLEGAAALTVLDGMDRMYVAQGKKILEVDLKKARPSDEALLELLLGRSGKLRAPTVRSGKKVLVGYNAELFETVLG